MHNENRRYDLDWIRVIAIGLLLVYHVAIGFQPWGMMIAFITNQEPWLALWTPMSMLNVWRIPLLFFVSGMGVYFALQNRSWKQLLIDRGKRILIPFVFGMFCIVPLHWYIWQQHYTMDLHYMADPGHLWFLGNIVVYVLLFTPLFVWLKTKAKTAWSIKLKSWLATPVGLVVIIISFVIEAMLINPRPFELYATTRHGFFIGLLGFLFGYLMVWSGTNFWNMLMRWRWVFLITAIGLFLTRLLVWNSAAPNYWLSIESNAWIFTVLAFGCKHLNKSSKTLHYLSRAAYSVYTVHMIFLYAASALIFPMLWPPAVKFIAVLAFTLAGCLLSYEAIRRIKYVRLLFGLTEK